MGLAGEFAGDGAVFDAEGLFDLLFEVEGLVAGEVVGVEFFVAAGAVDVPELVVGAGAVFAVGDVAFGVDLIDHDAGDAAVAEPGKGGVGDDEFAAFDGDAGFVDERGDGPVGDADADAEVDDGEEFGGGGGAHFEGGGVPGDEEAVPDEAEGDEEEDGEGEPAAGDLDAVWSAVELHARGEGEGWAFLESDGPRAGGWQDHEGAAVAAFDVSRGGIHALQLKRGGAGGTLQCNRRGHGFRGVVCRSGSDSSSRGANGIRHGPEGRVGRAG